MAQTDLWVSYLQELVDEPVYESPPGSNRTRLGNEYGWNGVAWCAITQSLAALHTFGHRVLWTAGVADAMGRAQRGENGMTWIGPGDEIRVGDLPCYDFKFRRNPVDMHIGGVINPGTQAKFEAIEGNWGNRVSRLWRDRHYVMGFIRMPFQSSGLGLIPQEINMPFKLHYAQADAKDGRVFLVNTAIVPKHVQKFEDAEYWANKEGHVILSEGDHDLGPDSAKQVRKGIILDEKGRRLFGIPAA